MNNMMRVNFEGRVVERPIDYYEINESRHLRPIPVLGTGEEVFFSISGECTVIKTRDPVPFGIDELRRREGLR